MTTDNTRIPLDLSLDEFKIIHEALMAQPYGAVERLVGKLRQAAAAAMQAARGETKQETAQS
ncbi:MAG: hypothetical protein GX615_06755 [Lentisphaerae bacterium]|jgi:hypothetical protein|nr:hypothetical protein [Lentisphaerota bacterium]